MAKPTIAQREAKDHFEPSHPQMSVGANIAVKLQELERELDGGATQEARIRAVSGQPSAPTSRAR